MKPGAEIPTFFRVNYNYQCSLNNEKFPSGIAINTTDLRNNHALTTQVRRLKIRHTNFTALLNKTRQVPKTRPTSLKDSPNINHPN
jgi:hypothetical protein